MQPPRAVFFPLNLLHQHSVLSFLLLLVRQFPWLATILDLVHASSETGKAIASEPFSPEDYFCPFQAIRLA